MRQISTFFFFLNAVICFSQSDIGFVFNSTHSGRNVALSYSKTISKNEFGLGLRYNINRITHSDDQNKSYMKRLYATKPYQYFGIDLFYHRSILNWTNIKPYLVYDLQVTHSTSRNRMFLPCDYDNDGNALYREVIEYFGPYTWLEQNIGIGFKENLFSNLYLTQKIGAGTSFIMGYDNKRLNRIFNWFEWEFGYLIQVGLIYRIKKVD